MLCSRVREIWERYGMRRKGETCVCIWEGRNAIGEPCLLWTVCQMMTCMYSLGVFFVVAVRHDYPGQKDEQSTIVNTDTVCHSI